MIATRAKINTILKESDFGTFAVGFMIFVIVYGAITETLKKGKSAALKRKLNGEFRRIAQLLNQYPDVRQDPLTKKVLGMAVDVLDGAEPDPKIMDALEALKIKYRDQWKNTTARPGSMDRGQFQTAMQILDRL